MAWGHRRGSYVVRVSILRVAGLESVCVVPAHACGRGCACACACERVRCASDCERV